MSSESHVARHGAFLAAGTTLFVNGNHVVGGLMFAVALYEWYRT